MKKGYYFVILTGILSGTIVFGGAVFAKLGLSLFQIAVFRTVFSLLLFPYLLYTGEFKVSKKLLLIFIVFGFFEALAVLSQFAPVVMGVPVSTTVLLLYTAPLWTVILSRLLFKERITGMKIVAVALVLLGVVFLADPRSIGGSGSVSGVLIALCGGIFLSLWTVFGKLCSNEKSSPAKTQFYGILSMLVFLLILHPIMATFISDQTLMHFSVDFSARMWLYLVIFSVFSSLIPHISYYHGIKEIPASSAGVILLLEPLAGTVLAALFLSQAITPNVFVGGILILAANYLVIRHGADNFAKEISEV
jgi:drug/metabolite transporter, DME family